MQRENRLRDRRDFRRVFKYGKSAANRHFVLYAMVKREGGPPRVGVSISKKVSKHAVDRNRVKRLVKEVVRPLIGHIPDGRDLVIIAREPADDLDYRQVEDSLRHLFKKTGLLK